MIRVKGRYRDGKLELEHPLALPDGTEVLIALERAELTPEEEDEAFRQLGLERLAQELDNPEDAIYDDWKKLYGV